MSGAFFFDEGRGGMNQIKSSSWTSKFSHACTPHHNDSIGNGSHHDHIVAACSRRRGGQPRASVTNSSRLCREKSAAKRSHADCLSIGLLGEKSTSIPGQHWLCQDKLEKRWCKREATRPLGDFGGAHPNKMQKAGQD